jgi:glycosyltransferase involved in cell wall biosynthesis
MNNSHSHLSNLKVILCHDWLTGMRGGERVLEQLCYAFPNAPIYTLIHNISAISEIINSHAVTTSWLQHLPSVFHYYRYLLPLFPSAVERIKPIQADLLISTSHCVAKGLKPQEGTRHLCYCFTPMRYAWGFYDEYFGQSRLTKMAMHPLLAHLREWDRKVCSRVDRFVTLSRYVQKRIQNYYGREADIVYPPVNIDFFTPDPEGIMTDTKGQDLGNYDLIVSAFAPYKRIDLALAAYNRSGYSLVIAGTGQDLSSLRSYAGKNITFTGWVSDERLRELYRHCRLLIFPGIEEFGIVPVEVQACGRPVVAFGQGGALETVVGGETGTFFQEQTEESLLQAVDHCANSIWNPLRIRANAERFSKDQFLRGLTESIEKCLTVNSE